MSRSVSHQSVTVEGLFRAGGPRDTGEGRFARVRAPQRDNGAPRRASGDALGTGGTHLIAVEALTSNCRVASRADAPAATKPITRTRKSFEYALGITHLTATSRR